jgi:hypothetical protein
MKSVKGEKGVVFWIPAFTGTGFRFWIKGASCCAKAKGIQHLFTLPEKCGAGGIA